MTSHKLVETAEVHRLATVVDEGTNAVFLRLALIMVVMMVVVLMVVVVVG